MTEFLNTQIPFTVAWWILGIAALIIEGVAIFNSVKGDTLSEHLWAWLGIARVKAKYPGVEFDGNHQLLRVYEEDASPILVRKNAGLITPTWTMRLARMAFLSAMLWFTLHIVTGGWV